MTGGRCNSFRVDMTLHAQTQGRPPGAANPGLDDGIPSGFKDASQVARGMGIRGGAVCHRRAISAGARV